MDRTIYLLDTLLGFIDVTGVPPLPYVGQAAYRFYNPPAAHLEICYLEAGDCLDLRIGDRPHPLRAGQVTIHSVRSGNYSHGHESMRGWCLFFDCRGQPALEQLATAPSLVAVADRAELIDTFARLTRVAYQVGRGPHGYLSARPLYHPDDAAGQPGAAWMLKAGILELLGRLRQEASPCVRSSDTRSAAVRQAVQTMRLEYHRPDLGLPDLARAVSLSPNHLGKLFRQEMGVAPMLYVQRLRLEQARHLLRRTDLRINEVARQVGYRDPLYFSRLFRRETGDSPRRYRDRDPAGPQQV